MTKEKLLPRFLEKVSTWAMGEREPFPFEMKGSAARPVEGHRVDSFYLGERRALREAAAKATVKRISGVQSLFSWYEGDGVVFAGVNGLAEAAVGQGYHTTIKEGGNKEAKRLVDEFGRVMNLDKILPNITKCMLIAGFCPIDTRISKVPSKCALKIIKPTTIKKIEVNQDGSIASVTQKTDDGKDKTIEGQYITWFVHNQVGNDVEGVSIIKPLETLLTTKQTAINNIGKIIEKRMFPDIIWKTKRDPAGLKELLAGKEVDEDLVLGWLDGDEMQNLAQIVEIRGNTQYEGYIGELNRLIYVGLYAPDLYYWKDATVASAQELTTLIDRNVNAIQRNVKRAVEAGFFTRLLEANGISVDELPKIVWGVKKTGFEDLDLQLIFLEAMRIGMVTEKNVQALFDQAGLDVGELGYARPPEKEEPEEKPERVPEKEPEEEPEETEKIFE